jgi:hypothetical protein
MTIQVPFHLRRRARSEPTVALYLPSRRPHDLVAVCARLALDPRSRVFDLAGGFLLELERPLNDLILGAVRLRAVAPALYVPVDAELVPSLLDDEARGMTRDWGLVFPPGGGALLFDRHSPIALNELLSVEIRPRRPWRAFPQPRPLTERLQEIAFKRPDPPAQELYDEFKRAIDEEKHGRKGSGRGDDAKTGGAEAGAPDQQSATKGRLRG